MQGKNILNYSSRWRMFYLWYWFKGDVAFVHHECLRRWLKTEENKKCSVCNYEYQITQDIMDFDSALKSIHWAMVVPSIVLILFIPYGTYLICRQAEKHDALKKQSTLIKSSAVIICLLIGKFKIHLTWAWLVNIVQAMVHR